MKSSKKPSEVAKEIVEWSEGRLSRGWKLSSEQEEEFILSCAYLRLHDCAYNVSETAVLVHSSDRGAHYIVEKDLLDRLEKVLEESNEAE